MRTLVINTYGGSLLLGATAVGAEIIGSYEDAGFGEGIQWENFPRLNFVSERKDWPAQDLSETVVIAHPPCSAFSVQNNSYDPNVKGAASQAFACTRHVLEYAMKNKAVAVAVESVMGAMQGAWPIHDRFAADHGYHLYRILQNGAMFGAQWRERFWVVYVRKGAGPDELQLALTPRWRNVGQQIAGHEDGPPPRGLERMYDELRERLEGSGAFTREDLRWLFERDHRSTSITNIIAERKGWTDRHATFLMYVGTFASSQLIYASPTGLACCLLGGTWYYANGRTLSENAYKRIMGFPADYRFPTKYRGPMRMYLSKGVIPQVAAWILEQVSHHLGEGRVRDLSPLQDPAETVTGRTYHLAVRPGHIADFRFRKRDWPLGPTGLEVPTIRGEAED